MPGFVVWWASWPEEKDPWPVPGLSGRWVIALPEGTKIAYEPASGKHSSDFGIRLFFRIYEIYPMS